MYDGGFTPCRRCDEIWEAQISGAKRSVVIVAVSADIDHKWLSASCITYNHRSLLSTESCPQHSSILLLLFKIDEMK